MWMGNLMFRKDQESGKTEECFMIDFHSAQFLSPATDLAHLLLTSTTRQYRKEHWDEVVKHYYDVFNRTLAEFGLVLRHLGTTFNDFLYEVKRALRGQFLCVAFIIPIGNFWLSPFSTLLRRKCITTSHVHFCPSVMYVPCNNNGDLLRSFLFNIEPLPLLIHFLSHLLNCLSWNVEERHSFYMMLKLPEAPCFICPEAYFPLKIWWGLISKELWAFIDFP